MAVSRALRRLLRVLDIEEEQRRAALESALGELRQLEQALAAAEERERRGRQLVRTGGAGGAFTGRTADAMGKAADLRADFMVDRVAGIEEMRAAVRRAAALKPLIAQSQAEAAELREQFLAKRVERRQAETLIEEAEARDAVEAARRGQQVLDDWYLNRFRGAKSEVGRVKAGDPEPGPGTGSSSTAKET
ncbi:MAG: hypothetical protein ACRD3N_13565 [Terracidiphilus sp.]